MSLVGTSGGHAAYRRRCGRVAGLLAGAGVLVLVAGAGTTAVAAGHGGFPQAYNPETVAGFTNTFTPPATSLSPACPNAITATPGSDPASVALNTALNDASSFVSGGQIHYVYSDNPHGAAFNFTIQTCQVAYPADFFTASDFDPSTGVLINSAFSKQDLDNGTQIDGASLDGISDPQGDIYFSWTVQPLANGTWVCNFARDIRANHGGDGNRKATPTCAQVNAHQDLTLCKVAGPNVSNGEVFQFAVTGPNGYTAQRAVAAGTCTTLPGVPVGQVMIKEKVPSPYQVQAIQVTPAGSTVAVNRLVGKVVIALAADPVTVTYTNERFTCVKTATGTTPAGLVYKQYTLTDPEGITSTQARQVHDATVTTAPFSPGTAGPVTVTVTRTIAGTPGHAIVFEQNTSGAYHHCDPNV